MVPRPRGGKKTRRAIWLCAVGLLLVAALMKWGGRSREELLQGVHALSERRGTYEDVRRLLGEPADIYTHDRTPPLHDEVAAFYRWHLCRTTFEGEGVVTLHVTIDKNGNVLHCSEMYRLFDGADAWRLRWLRLRHLVQPTGEYDEFINTRTFWF